MPSQRASLGGLLFLVGAVVAGQLAPLDVAAQTLIPPLRGQPPIVDPRVNLVDARDATARAQGAPSYFLSGSGFYANFAARTVNPQFVEFEPNYHLWSDGDHKRRFLYLPPGAKIDTTTMDHWRFPAGTTIVKEFKTPDGSKYLEHRLIVVQPNGTDVFLGTYVWNDAQTDAALDLVGVTGLFGTTWNVPSQPECHSCHDGDLGKVLGISAIQAKPDFLASLIAQGRLSNPPAAGFDFSVPGTPVERDALGYLHANCGHCHNQNGLMASLTQNLRLNVADRRVSDTTTYRSAVGQSLQEFQSLPGVAARGITERIVPGDPAHSAITYRMHFRNDANMMPELGTSIPDTGGIALVENWIRSMTRRLIALRRPPVAATPPILDPNCTPIINEVHMQSKIRGQADEFVELFNPCAAKFAFGPTWTLVVHEALGPRDPGVLKNLSGMTIEPNGYLLLGGTGYSDPSAQPQTTFTPATGVMWPTDRTPGTRLTWEGRMIPNQTLANSRFAGGWLSSTAATVALTNGSQIVDSVSWGTASVRGRHRHVMGVAVLPPPAGLSLARRPNAANTRQNQSDFIVQQPTPGRTNF